MENNGPSNNASTLFGFLQQLAREKELQEKVDPVVWETHLRLTAAKADPTTTEMDRSAIACFLFALNIYATVRGGQIEHIAC